MFRCSCSAAGFVSGAQPFAGEVGAPAETLMTCRPSAVTVSEPLTVYQQVLSANLLTKKRREGEMPKIESLELIESKVEPPSGLEPETC